MNLLEIKNQIKIEDIISEYVNLSFKNDDNLKGVCPVHIDKDPSFLVNTKEQYFKCFGCDFKGDVFDFIAKMHNLTKDEAVRYLAKKLGIHLEGETYLNILQNIKEYFVSRVDESSDYLFNQRGYNKEIVDFWELGYSGGSFDLYKEFQHYKNELVELGLLQIMNKNTPVETYMSSLFDRVTIPLNDLIGTIGFSGRTIYKEFNPKYVNTQDNFYFSKSRYLFGLNKASKSIKEKGYGFLIEGQFDIITMHCYDFKNSVGSIGLSLKQEQVLKLKSLAPLWLMMYDGDNAGLIAIKRNAKEFIKIGLPFEVLLLPDGEDPDSYLKKDGDLNDLENYDGFTVIKEIYTREEIIEIIKQSESPDCLDKNLLNHFKINIDTLYKKVKNKNVSKKFVAFSRETQLALFCEVFPDFKNKLNENDLDLIEDVYSNSEYLNFKMNNYYKKVKLPEEVFNKLLEI
jgi:DNA primase